MPRLFGIDIAGIVAREIGPGLRPSVLTKVAPGTRTPGQLSGGTNPVETAHSCRGMEDTLSRLRPDMIVKDARGVVLLIGGTLPVGIVPQAGDRVAVDGGADQRILNVLRDPAAATYLCQVA